MIGKDRELRKVCSTYEQVENYSQAIADKENRWHLHHRRETDEMKSRQQLIDEGKYYNVDPSELIFLTISEHTKLHNANLREETRNKLSNNCYFKGKDHSGGNNPMYGVKLYGEKNGMYGKHHSEESKKKISKANKGHKDTEEARKKKSKSHFGEKNQAFGKHWWNNKIIQVFSKECPGEDFEKGMLKRNKSPRKSFK